MMYGHIESASDVATHLDILRGIQQRSMEEFGVGFTEFVPLSFISQEAPMYKSQVAAIGAIKEKYEQDQQGMRL